MVGRGGEGRGEEGGTCLFLCEATAAIRGYLLAQSCHFEN